MSQARWKCPECASGALAPRHPRRNDVRRYCLPCSKRTGRLVERVCPTLEKRREVRKASRTARAAQERKELRQAGATWPNVLHKVWQLMLRLPLAKQHKVRSRLRFMKNTHGRRVGQAEWGVVAVKTHRGPGPTINTMLHELAHEVVRRRFGSYRPTQDKNRPHGKVFKSTLANLCDEWVEHPKGRELVGVVGFAKFLYWAALPWKELES